MMSSLSTTREQRRQLIRENARQPTALVEVDRNDWPANVLAMQKPPVIVWRSRDFLVQAFSEPGGVSRLSVNRTTLGDNGRWIDNISWDELQEIKRQTGFGQYQAVEIYPDDKNIVNVANMRHLWVLKDPLPFGWRKS